MAYIYNQVEGDQQPKTCIQDSKVICTKDLLTDGVGDLDLDGDLQKFQKQPNLISTCSS